MSEKRSQLGLAGHCGKKHFTLIGTFISHYQVVGKLGAGGMGEVYLARDTKLNRDVALKILPAEFSKDQQRMARFQREAQLLASLNHPHIAQIYGLETAAAEPGERTAGHDSQVAEKVTALVMELVEGPDLSERIAQGPFQLDDALGIALQVCDALDSAHAKGIIHRDLKPGNIKLTNDGKVKVLDFGLGKAMADEDSLDPHLSQSPTLSLAATQAGMILGTAAYMSPEQARGKSVDKRADIWAFGCVLFEMLTGQRPFSGTDVGELLADVIRAEPAWEKLNPGFPGGVRTLLEKCLRKDPAKRFRDIGDVHLEIEEILAAPRVPHGAVTRERPGLWSLLPWLLAAALGLTVLWLAQGEEAPTQAPLRKLAIDLSWTETPNWTDFLATLSPDGRRLAYLGRSYNAVDLRVRELDSLESRGITSAREMHEFVFSHDSEWLAFLNGTTLAKISVHGGDPQILAKVAPSRIVRGISWGPKGDILVGSDVGLFSVPSAGGKPRQVVKPSAERGDRLLAYPSHLPDGETALLSVEGAGGASQIAIVDLSTGELEMTSLTGSEPRYVSTGHLLLRQGETLLAVGFDWKERSVRGSTVPVLEHVRVGPSVAEDGTLLFVPTRGEDNARLVWVDRDGRPTPIPGERLDYSHLDLSAQGDLALLNIEDDIYVLDLKAKTRRLLTSSGWFPVWTPDGLRATFNQRNPMAGVVEANREAPDAGAKPGVDAGPAERVYWKLADGSAPEELIPLPVAEASSTGSSEGDGGLLFGTGGERAGVVRGTPVPTSWNPSDGSLAFFDGQSDIWVVHPGEEPRAFLNSRFNERSGRFSPDGKWMAYVSDETGDYQVYVVPYPGPGPKVAVSIDGGLSPIWSADGRELFFRKGGKLLTARVLPGAQLRFGEPVELFEGPYTLDLMGHQRYDVAADGQHFLMVENSDDFRLVLIENWFQELNALAPLP